MRVDYDVEQRRRPARPRPRRAQPARAEPRPRQRASTSPSRCATTTTCAAPCSATRAAAASAAIWRRCGRGRRGVNRRTVVLGAGGASPRPSASAPAALWRGASEDDAGAPDVAVDIWSLHFRRVDGAPIADGRAARPAAAAQFLGDVVRARAWSRCRCSIASRASAAGRAAGSVLALAVDQPDPVRRFIAERTCVAGRPRRRGRPRPVAAARQHRRAALPFTAAFDADGDGDAAQARRGRCRPARAGLDRLRSLSESQRRSPTNGCKLDAYNRAASGD